jgi:hypothetical protein
MLLTRQHTTTTIEVLAGMGERIGMGNTAYLIAGKRGRR